jgi:hypothetical protein
MPISATVTFSTDLKQVSITDEVFGGFCKDIEGKEINNRQLDKDRSIAFRAVPDDEKGFGTVTISGAEQAGDPPPAYSERFEFSNGNTLYFPKAKSPTPLDVIKKLKHIGEFTEQFLLRR